MCTVSRVSTVFRSIGRPRSIKVRLTGGASGTKGVRTGGRRRGVRVIQVRAIRLVGTGSVSVSHKVVTAPVRGGGSPEGSICSEKGDSTSGREGRRKIKETSNMVSVEC